jgi:hypothetical protein
LQQEPIDVPSDIGYFRIVGHQLDISAEPVKVKANLIPRIDCRKGIKEYFKNKKYRAVYGAKYPWCFDLNSEHAVIGGKFSSVAL